MVCEDDAVNSFLSFLALPKEGRCEGWDNLIGYPLYSEKSFHFEE